MRERVTRESGHFGRLAFMLVVTAWLLGAVFVQASRGPAGIIAAAAFAFPAGFGLEFVCATWTGRAPQAGRRSTLHR